MIRVPCKKPVATRVLILVKHKVLTHCQAHVCHKFSQDLLCWEPEQFQKDQNLLAITPNIHVNNLNVTAVHGRLQSLQHVSINFICIEGGFFYYMMT
jgi:hypothetical protein